MKETFEDYLQRLKDRRTEDGYKYTDEDFVQYNDYIKDCWLTNLSVYKCLEFMSFAEKDMDNHLFNREPKQETLEEVAEIFVNNRFIKQSKDEDIYASKSSIIESHIIFAKWQAEQSKKKHIVMLVGDKVNEETKQKCMITEIMQMDAKMAYDSLHKQETLEEVAEKYVDTFEYGIAHPRRVCKNAFINGAKWQQERMYSEEDMKLFGDWCRNGLLNTEYSVDRLDKHLEQWKQFKKK